MAVALHKRILRAIAHLAKGRLCGYCVLLLGLTPCAMSYPHEFGQSPHFESARKCRLFCFFRSICEYNSHTSLSRGGIDFGYRAIKIYDLLYRNFTPTFVITENPNKIKGV